MIFDNLKRDIETTVNEELERFYKMSGVFIQTLMHSAESQSVNLEADVTFMENL